MPEGEGERGVETESERERARERERGKGRGPIRPVKVGLSTLVPRSSAGSSLLLEAFSREETTL